MHDDDVDPGDAATILAYALHVLLYDGHGHIDDAAAAYEQARRFVDLYERRAIDVAWDDDRRARHDWLHNRLDGYRWSHVLDVFHEWYGCDRPDRSAHLGRRPG